MLRASSLGLRCYRHQLHHGALRCSAQLSSAHRTPRDAAVQTTPDAPERPSWSERLARESGSAGSEAQEEGGAGVGDAGETGTVSYPPQLPSTCASGVSAPANGLALNAQPVRRRPRGRTYTLPEQVKVSSPRTVAQELEADRQARIRFEKNIPVALTSVNPRPHEIPRVMAVRSTVTRAVRDKMDIKPLPLADGWAHTPERDEHRGTRAHLLGVLAKTQDIEAAWDAYSSLMSLPRFEDRLPIPWQHLHRLARLIASVHPRTRSLFIRLLSVVSTIHRTGGTVQLWEWNALIDFAGKGWRKTTLENFRTSLDVYHDLVSSNSPGTCFARKSGDVDAPQGEQSEASRPHWEPDIWTFTTILNIAISTSNVKSVRQAAYMLENSGHKPNAVTYLSYIRYYTKLGKLLGVRSILAQMVTNNMELGLDGVNACLWAFGRNNRLDIAEAIYRVLRSNITEEPDREVEQLRKQLDSENIRIPRHIVPDHITYSSLAQVYAYRGHLEDCLTVFMDMVNALDPPGKKEMDAGDPKRARLYLPVYRAIFIGFVRHGKPPQAMPSSGIRYGAGMLASSAENDGSPWTLKALDALFEDFLRIPRGAEPTENLIFWILTAYARVTGEDKEKLREVYRLLEERFGGQWGGRLARVREAIFAPGTSVDSSSAWGRVDAAQDLSWG